MRQLKFRYASAKNFICFGPEGIELFFDDYGKLVLVRGENFDDGTEEEPASNGAGKSTLQDILSYGLYGKTIKKPKQLFHGDVINTKIGEGLEVEVQFDDFRVVRGRKPNKLLIWESKDHIWDKSSLVDIAKGKQKWLEGKVGLTHRAFCSVIAVDDSDSYAFLEADTPTKRLIVENLFGLDKYRAYHKSAKRLRDKAVDVVEAKQKDYERIAIELQSCKKRIVSVQAQEQTWKLNVQTWIANTQKKIEEKQEALSHSDVGAAMVKFQHCQDEINQLQNKLIEVETKRAKLDTILADSKGKLSDAQAQQSEVRLGIQEFYLNAKRFEAELKVCQEQIAALSTLQDGQRCPTCHAVISKENYGAVLSHQENLHEQNLAGLIRESDLMKKEKEKFGEKSVLVSKLEQHLQEGRKAMATLDGRMAEIRQQITHLSRVHKPDGNSVQQVLENEILELRRQVEERKRELDGNSPYYEILAKALEEELDKTTELSNKTEEIKKAESVLPYYKFWLNAFGDDGIRKFVVDGAIPALNARISYWLQHLIDNKLELSFDNQLNETVKRNGNNAFYHSMSKGEKRRINLAVSQAFSYVMTLHSGCCPSLVFLDEITGGGIDRVGIIGVYNMVFELAKERQVFVTTHNENLLELLQGCEAITLRKRDDVTTLVR